MKIKCSNCRIEIEPGEGWMCNNNLSWCDDCEARIKIRARDLREDDWIAEWDRPSFEWQVNYLESANGIVDLTDPRGGRMKVDADEVFYLVEPTEMDVIERRLR